MNIKNTICSTAAVLALAMTASGAGAAIVETGVTKIGDGGGIDLAGPGTASAATLFPTVAALAGSDWVWGSGGVNSSASFEFTFDMTGFDVTTASLSGLLVVDNEATVSLNGTVIDSFLGAVTSHFETTNAYGTTDTSLFNTGVNVLTYDVNDLGGLWGLRANVEVTADMALSDIPLPAGAPLMIGGLALLGWMRKRRA